MRYQHPTLEERAVIAPMRVLGWTIREIARTLGRAPSTISREVHRNTDPWGGYAGYWAHRDAQRRRQQAPRAGRLGYPPLAVYVQAKLHERWSPEQIAHRLPLDFPNDLTLRVCHQTLYTWIATDRADGGGWYWCLRQSRRHRRKRYGSGPRVPWLKGRISLTQRPPNSGPSRTVRRLGRRYAHRARPLGSHHDARRTKESFSARGNSSSTDCGCRHQSNSPAVPYAPSTAAQDTDRR